jgi:hypothetical protein
VADAGVPAEEKVTRLLVYGSAAQPGAPHVRGS